MGVISWKADKSISPQTGAMSARVSKETLGDWAAEGKKLKDERRKEAGGPQADDILNASINDLFRPEKVPPPPCQR